LTHTEGFAELVSEIEDNVKRRKTDEGLRFAYGGAGYDLGIRAERVALVEEVTDTMLAYCPPGMRPDPALIERLTDVILHEELTDMHPDKVTRTEYPFFSAHQLELRRDRETSLKAAEETGTDGRSYRLPKRRKRSAYENYAVDAAAKIRNSERAAQYKRDTAAGPVREYNVREHGFLTANFVHSRGIGERWRDRLSSVYNAE